MLVQRFKDVQAQYTVEPYLDLKLSEDLACRILDFLEPVHDSIADIQINYPFVPDGDCGKMVSCVFIVNGKERFFTGMSSLHCPAGSDGLQELYKIIFLDGDCQDMGID
jgi:hypothetical protein